VYFMSVPPSLLLVAFTFTARIQGSHLRMDGGGAQALSVQRLVHRRIRRIAQRLAYRGLPSPLPDEKQIIHQPAG
jgi:hypothetical protein